MDTIHSIKKIFKSKARLSKLKRKFLKNIWVARGVVLVLVALTLIGLGAAVSRLLSNTTLGYYYDLGKNFVSPNIKKLSSIDGKINFAILGKGGKGHEAPDLTDTIIFASVDTKQKKVSTVSLPRDIWIPEMRAKINSAYYYGKQKQIGGGVSLAKSSIEEVVGLPVSYAIVIDFSGFKDIIDTLGGVNVDVENSFVDELYPISGKENEQCPDDYVDVNNERYFKCRYERIEFKKGLQKMDGETALKFVRSRHAAGDEGTDLARSARQAKVIAAIKNKILSPEILFSPTRIQKVFQAFKNSIETDLTDQQLAILARFIFEAKENQKSQVLPEELLVNPKPTAKYDYLYVFIPKDGNWNQVHKWIEDFLEVN